MSDRHLAAIQAAVAVALPRGCSVARVHHQAPRSGYRLGRPSPVAPGGLRVAVEITGWGPSLERRLTILRAVYDPNGSEEDAASSIFRSSAAALGRLSALSAEAASVGLDLPLDGEGVMSTAHLRVDPDAVDTLIGFTGSREAARAWLAEQMKQHREELMPGINTSRGGDVVALLADADPIIRVAGPRLHLPFALDPIRPARGQGRDRPEGVVWEDDTICVPGILPEAVIVAAPGRRVSDLVSGTPVGHRRVSSVRCTDDFGMNDTVIVMETERVPVDGLI